MSKHVSLKGLALTAAASVMLLSASPAMGFEVSYDGGDTDFKLNGSMDSQKAGQAVTLKVTDKDGSIIHTRQTYTDAQGAYEFVFSFDYNGDATATVSENGALVTKPIYKSTPEEVSAALERLAGDESISVVIGEEAAVLQVDVEEYTSLSGSGLMDRFLNAQTITSVSDFREAYNLGKFLVNVENSAKDEVMDMEDTCPEVKEAADSQAGKVYMGLSKTVRAGIVGTLLGTTYEDMASYTKARDEATVIYLINTEDNSNAKYKIIEDNNDILGLPLSTYSSLEDKLDSFKEELFKGTFNGVADLKSKAQTAYTTVTAGDDGGSSSSPSSSASGGKSSNVTVSGSYTQEDTVTPLAEFSDLAGYDWAKTPIVVLAAKGVVNGKSQGIFAPGDNVTRAEFVKMLSGAFGISGNADMKFEDVPQGHWAYDYIRGAVANGIAEGISETQFGASMQITRQDMAVLCSRIMDSRKITAEGSEVDFADADSISAYAKDGVSKLARTGVINGVGDGRFAPLDFATRAEAAVIIYRLQEYCSGR